jgi:hypothetical protein
MEEMEEMKKLAKAGGYQHSTHPKGISLRDYYIGILLPVCYLNYVESAEKHGYTENWRIGVAKDVTQMVDVMLKERDKTQPEGSVSVRQCDVFSLPKN